MKKLLDKLRTRRTRKDDGASAVEYGLLVALIAVVIAGTVVVLGNVLDDQFNKACNTISGGTVGAECVDPNPAGGGDGD